MLYDITPPIRPELAVWPGDTPPSREVLMDRARGDSVTLSTLRATVHLGAHADAPSHYGTHAATMEQCSLEPYLGPCQVIRVAAQRGTRVTAGQIDLNAIRLERVLLATGTFPDPYHWNADFAAVAPELIDALHAHGVKLLGIDTPSVDLADSKNLPSHARLLATEMAVLEGLVLRDVPGGEYELIALPLPLVGFDASPVRAVLRTL